MDRIPNPFIPASIRFNNPGAQYPGPTATAYGSTGHGIIGGGHKIAQFSDPTTGAAAQFSLFDRKYTGMPLGAAIREWSGNNSSPAYISSVARETGLDPQLPITRQQLADPRVAIPLAKAMARFEAGRDYPLSDDDWEKAHSMAFGGGAPSAGLNAPSGSPAGMPMQARDLPSGGTSFESAAMPPSASLTQGRRSMPPIDPNSLQAQFAQQAQPNPMNGILGYLAGALQGGNVGQSIGQGLGGYLDVNRTENALQQKRLDALQQQSNIDRDFGLKQKTLDATLASKDPADWMKDPSDPAGVKLMPVPGGKADPNYIKSAAEAKVAAGETFDDDTLDTLADQVIAGDNSPYTSVARGVSGPANLVRLRKRVAEKAAAQGLSGADLAMRGAEYQGTKAGQRTVGVKSANIELAANEFKEVLPVVQAASKAVDRTQYPALNKIIQAWQEGTGDPKIVAFGGGINTLVNVYARAISPTGVGSVSDKEHAREILQKAWSSGQFDAAVGMMQQEIDAALRSPEKVRDEMRRRFIGGQGGAAPATAPAPAALAAPAAPAGVVKMERGPDGTLRRMQQQ